MQRSKTRQPESLFQQALRWAKGGEPDTTGLLAKLAAPLDEWVELGDTRPSPITSIPGTSDFAEWLREKRGYTNVAEDRRLERLGSGRPKGLQRDDEIYSKSKSDIALRFERGTDRGAATVSPEPNLAARRAEARAQTITTRKLRGRPNNESASLSQLPDLWSTNSARRELFVGDCLEVLATREEASVNLIVTSPPYDTARQSAYGGIPPDQYVEWWLERAEQFRRVLTRDGSLVVNIKEGCDQGERSTYVMELVLAMRAAGWLWTEEYIWHKRNCAPGKWPNRFRDAWERCLHFTLCRDFAMYQAEVTVPIGDWAKTRLSNLSEIDCTRDASASGSPFAKNVSNWLGRASVYPTNVLHFATECTFVGHPAAFPEPLPRVFHKAVHAIG